MLLKETTENGGLHSKTIMTPPAGAPPAGALPKILLYHMIVFFSLFFFSKVFTSGSGNSTVVLEFVVQVRFVRFYPVSGYKCVKLELHGCTSMKGGCE